MRSPAGHGLVIVAPVRWRLPPFDAVLRMLLAEYESHRVSPLLLGSSSLRLAHATRLCEASFGILTLFGGDLIRAVAQHNAPVAYAEEMRRDSVHRFGGAL